MNRPQSTTRFARFSQQDGISLLGSLVVHTAILAILAAIILPHRAAHESINTLASIGLPENQSLDTIAIVDEIPTERQESGGSESLFTTESDASATPANSSPNLDIARPLELSSTGVAAVGLSERVRQVSTSLNFDAATGSAGKEGAGGGTFFGTKVDGQKVVFVVDASRSMNHPHPGPTKTRFGRVKVELLNTIASMNEEQKFFIVFFNDRPIPMPAPTLVSASPANQKQHLTWMAYLRAEGRTDPESSLLAALSLGPDVIYFLTDGQFPYRVIPNVSRVNRVGITIHTIGFASDEGEKFLRELAVQNNGTYKFIPEDEGLVSPTAISANTP